jgi:hypothetical protein
MGREMGKKYAIEVKGTAGWFPIMELRGVFAKLAIARREADKGSDGRYKTRILLDGRVLEERPPAKFDSQ